MAPVLVYRPLGTRIAAGIYGVFAIWWLGGLLVAGRAREAAQLAPVLLLVGIVVHALFWRPAVIVDDEAVELRNVVRDVRIRWPALERVETRFTLTLVVGEHRYQSWAASAPGRPSILPIGRRAPGTGGLGRSSRDLGVDSGAAAFMVEQRWQACRHTVDPASDGVEVTQRWNAVDLGLLALTLVGGAILELLA